MGFVVAHRAGNDLALLRRAQGLGLELIEADVHLYRGRLEVRHLKALGPLLWDCWYLASPRTPRLTLDELLAAADAPLMLDLKGGRRLGRRVAEAVDRPLTVCARRWSALEPFAGRDDVRVVHSVGSRRQLRALRRRFADRRLHGVSIHRRLLDRATVADLRRRAELIVSWPVATHEQARELWGWGVDGVITERFEALA